MTVPSLATCRCIYRSVIRHVNLLDEQLTSITARGQILVKPLQTHLYPYLVASIDSYSIVGYYCCMSITERPHTRSSWEQATLYQIYPRSFEEERDAPADLRGEGSLKGITHKLDYLQTLGVNAIWVSPFYPSPMKDGGYDVLDHTGIDPRYGTLADFDELVTQAHERDMKVMIDLIPNHTSDQHPWFQASRRQKDKSDGDPNNKKEWYIWHDPALGGGPPNNWASMFSLSQMQARREGRLDVADGEPTPPLSAWTLDPERGQYYLHSFAEQQPDLNWENPAVREAIKKVMRLWIARGVDGFRVDAVNFLGKDPTFADEARNPDYQEGLVNPYYQLMRYRSNGYPDTLYLYLKELTNVLEEYPDRDLRIIFEAYMPEADLEKINEVNPHRASTFNFARLVAPWEAQTHDELLSRYHANLPEGAIPNQVNGNHDKSRLASRLGAEAARAAAVLNLTLPGMVIIYNGEEGGFTDVEIPPERRDDRLGNRDGARTPMLWTSGRNAGFSKAPADKLWLPIDPDYQRKNLERQMTDPRSSLSLYRQLLRLRNSSEILQHGDYYPLFTDHRDVLAFARRHNGGQLITLTNFSERPVHIRTWRAKQAIGRVVISSTMHPQAGVVTIEDGLTLRPNEAIVIASSA
jgi:alpha-glucosidase